MKATEFKRRRTQLMKMMGKNTIAILPSASELVRNRDASNYFRVFYTRRACRILQRADGHPLRPRAHQQTDDIEPRVGAERGEAFGGLLGIERQRREDAVGVE